MTPYQPLGYPGVLYAFTILSGSKSYETHFLKKNLLLDGFEPVT